MPLLQPPGSCNVNPLDLGRALQLPHIPLRHLGIRIFHSVEHLILPAQNKPQNRRADARDGHETHDDAERGPVVRLLGVPVGVGRPDGGHVADGVHESEGGGTFGWGTRDGVGGPGVDL